MKNPPKAIAIIAIVLCALSVFAALASCGENEEKSGGPENPAGQENTGTAADGKEAADGLVLDNVPQLDFGGYEYRVFYCDYGERSGVEMYPEEMDGDILNDTIYRRNQKIQERFNVKFAVTTVEDGKGATVSLATLTKNVQAGDDAYDMHLMVDREATTAATKGLLYPVNEMEHIDLTRPYWKQDVNAILTVGGKLAWALSDEMIPAFENTCVMFFNKKQAQDLQLDDLYNIVRSGEWTFDKFFEYAKMAMKNVSGGAKFTNDDFWGIVAAFDEFYPNFWIGAGIKSIDKDAADIPYFALPGNERFLTVGAKIFDNIKADGMYVESHTSKLPTGSGVAAGVDFFRNGHALFIATIIQEMVNLRDMPDDFGVLPFPKFEAAQERYYSRLTGSRPFVIPATNQKPEAAGALMEAMACETYNTVYPAYYESSLKTKFSRDPDTCEMLDLIREVTVYDLGDTIWYEAVRSPITTVFNGKANTLASWIEKNEQKVNKAIQKTVEAILDAN